MSDNHRTDCDRDTQLKNFAGELTSAGYPLVLRRVPKDQWIKVELGLWRALAETVKEWAWQRPPASSAVEFEAWREGLLGALTGSALSIALNNGIDGPRPEKEVLVAPVPRWAVAVGKVLGGATIAVLQSMILVMVAPFAGIYPSPLMVVELLLLGFLISVAVTSLGTAIAARMRSMQSFQMIMNFLVMPLYFLSGAMFPLASAPAWMQTLMVLDPLTYGVDVLRNVVLSGVELPAGSAPLVGLVRGDMLTDVSILGLVAVPLVGVAAVQFNRAS